MKQLALLIFIAWARRMRKTIEKVAVLVLLILAYFWYLILELKWGA